MREIGGRNPLETLGISRAALRGLPEEKALELVGHMYRKVFSPLHHPDKGGDAAVFSRISSAYNEATGTPEDFRFFLREYLKVTSFQQEVNQAELRATLAQRRFEQVAAGSVDYAMAFAGLGRTRNVFNLGPARIVVRDLSAIVNSDFLLDPLRGETVENQIELKLQRERTKAHPSQHIISALEEEQQGVRRKIYRTVEVGVDRRVISAEADGHESVTGQKIVGAIRTPSPYGQGAALVSIVDVLRRAGLDYSARRQLAHGPAAAGTPHRYETRQISPQSMAKIMLYFTAELESRKGPAHEGERVYLVSAGTKADGSAVLTLEGEVVSIEPRSDTTASEMAAQDTAPAQSKPRTGRRTARK